MLCICDEPTEAISSKPSRVCLCVSKGFSSQLSHNRVCEEFQDQRSCSSMFFFFFLSFSKDIRPYRNRIR